MTRPAKQIVDYFPHDTNQRKTIFILKSKYGNDGYAFWFQLLEILGSTEGHYYDCNQPDNQEYLTAYMGLEWDKCRQILDTLSNSGAIDSELWSKNIVWSDGFIERLTELYRRRQGLCPQKPTLSGINDGINPQSKVKESKEEKRKEKASCSEPENPASEPAENFDLTDPVIETIPLIKKDGAFELRESKIKELEQQFDTLDVRRVVKNFSVWCAVNPEKRKTRRGVMKALVGWCIRDTDGGKNLKGFSAGQRASPQPLKRPHVCKFCGHTWEAGKGPGVCCPACQQLYYSTVDGSLIERAPGGRTRREAGVAGGLIDNLTKSMSR